MALERLQQPDKYSRSPEHDRRRIEVVEGGWFILNRAKYRDSCGEQGKLEQHRDADRRYYQRRKDQLSDTDSDNSDIRTDCTGCVGDKKEKEKKLKPLSVTNAPDGHSPSRIRRKPNPKHSPVKEFIKEEWAQRNQKACPWGPAAAKQLDTLLSETPDWTVEDYRRCILNRFTSDGVAVSEDPKVFISRLPKYLSGPLNQFGQPKNRDRGHAPLPPSEVARRQQAGEEWRQ